METPETGKTSGLERLGETSGDFRDWGRPVETSETAKTSGLERLEEASGDFRDCEDQWTRERLGETPETGGDQWRLQRLGRLVETHCRY